MIEVKNITKSFGDNLVLDDVSVTLIPAPGAILLGTIGVGVVGWLRKRKTF